MIFPEIHEMAVVVSKSPSVHGMAVAMSSLTRTGNWKKETPKSPRYNLIMGITIFSIVGITTAILIVDLTYPLFDPRVRYY